ncbi:transposable element Tcb1 transposase [Trichonephila clavipes]|nr:transposable element Tcb1 transposase [Trichonephila clavipes]
MKRSTWLPIQLLRHVQNQGCQFGCDNMEIVSRAKWGARESISNVTMQTPVPHIFIHHTATSECNNFESCSQMMRTIQNFHMDNKVMSRRKRQSAFDQVSEFDRGRIVAYRDCGISFREMGSRAGRNQTTVIRICDRWMQEGTTDRRG